MADNACARLQYEIQAQLTQDSEYLVQLQTWFTLLKGMDEASGHSGKCSELILVKPQLESPASDLLGPSDRMACTIVHKGKSTLRVARAPVITCTIVHVSL
jgi:hypothetical protein